LERIKYLSFMYPIKITDYNPKHRKPLFNYRQYLEVLDVAKIFNASLLLEDYKNKNSTESVLAAVTKMLNDSFATTCAIISMILDSLDNQILELTICNNDFYDIHHSYFVFGTISSPEFVSLCWAEAFFYSLEHIS
ncbi:19997_t:CDS:2, partial [Gigaspora margarita]